MKNFILVLLLFILFKAPIFGFQSDFNSKVAWNSAGSLPLLNSSIDSMGLAGMFGGIHNEVVILAGGANFPQAPPWEGGEKKWWDSIFLLKSIEAQYEYIDISKYSLPKPLAYGASVSHSSGVLLIGGNNQDGPQKDVIQLSWDSNLSKLNFRKLPDLPYPMASISAVVWDSQIYVAGDLDSQKEGVFLRLDLNSLEKGWESLPAWPGSGRNNSSLVIQTDGEKNKIYLLGGRKRQENGVSRQFSDVLSFDPSFNCWQFETPIQNSHGQEIFLSAFTAKAIGSGHILLFGGVESEPFNTLEKIQLELENDNLRQSDIDSLISVKNQIMIYHKGFSRNILAFHTITKSWIELDKVPFECPVNSVLIPTDKGGLLVSGEISPGLRDPEIHEFQLVNNLGFGTLNYLVLIGYLGVLVFIGVRVSRKQHSVNDYFKAGGRVPWWAAGISVFGTQLSAITFMAIPAKTFATDWTLFFLLMTIILVAPLIIAWFLPFFRRLNLTSAYEYLELRFNRKVRLLGSSIYIMLQLGRLGIVLLLPSIALTVVTGIQVEVCILIMGVLSIFYTVMGGVEAVIWTDVIQVFVLLGGALVSLFFLVDAIGLESIYLTDFLIHSDKTKLFNWDLDFSGTAFWVVLIGGVATNIVQYGSDQTVVQRYLTTKDEATAAKGIRTGAWMVLPSALIFFSLGTALYLFYLKNPSELSPVLDNTDSIFPWYIITQLPEGVSGLLIAAVFAAAMSSLDSSMNSVATVITVDFYSNESTKRKIGALKFAKIITVLIGSIGTVLALWMANIGIPSLWDQFNMLVGLFAGGLGGIFLVGIFTDRTNAIGAIMGLAGTGAIQVLVKYQTNLSIHLYALIGLVSAFILSYLFSLLFQESTSKNSQGLTLKSLRSQKQSKKLQKVCTPTELVN